MTPPIPVKLLRAVADLPRTLRTTPRPRLIMTLLVKNEEELLERNLLFHKAMGVDGFIVTDNNSTDRTPDILRRYAGRGWILEVIREPATDYAQKAWVDRMIWRARTRYGADWIINADADEFWYAPTGCLKDAMRATRATAFDCPIRNVYPEEGKPWTEWASTVREVPDPAAYDLSRYSIFGRQGKKVAHRAAGYVQISMGNHKVTMLPRRSSASDIIVYHYNIRGKAQFMSKMINGGQQLEQHRSRHGGRHWRYFYELYCQGRLEAEYARVVGAAVRPRLEADGYIVADGTMPRMFRSLEKE